MIGVAVGRREGSQDGPARPESQSQDISRRFGISMVHPESGNELQFSDPGRRDRQAPALIIHGRPSDCGAPNKNVEIPRDRLISSRRVSVECRTEPPSPTSHHHTKEAPAFGFAGFVDLRERRFVVDSAIASPATLFRQTGGVGLPNASRVSNKKRRQTRNSAKPLVQEAFAPIV